MPGQEISLTVFRERKTFAVTSTLIKKSEKPEKEEGHFSEDDPSS